MYITLSFANWMLNRGCVVVVVCVCLCVCSLFRFLCNQKSEPKKTTKKHTCSYLKGKRHGIIRISYILYFIKMCLWDTIMTSGVIRYHVREKGPWPIKTYVLESAAPPQGNTIPRNWEASCTISVPTIVISNEVNCLFIWDSIFTQKLPSGSIYVYQRIHVWLKWAGIHCLPQINNYICVSRMYNRIIKMEHVEYFVTRIFLNDIAC